MTRAAIYARFSTEDQNPESIEDQVRLCMERAAAEKWSIAGVYTDPAISGASLIRPGIQNLLRDMSVGQFDIVLAEALDRLSRDLEDIAAVNKRAQFAGVKLFTLAEGEISALHVGLKGTMNAMFLKDLADKTRRGLRGVVEHGRSGGGITYGYGIEKRIDARTEEYVRGERHIIENEAQIVRRIFSEYRDGKSPRAIATQLNKQGVPGPSGNEWGASTIYGNRDRGTGILNNELYVGKLVWNRLQYRKDPDTGRRRSRLNPEREWVIKDVPHLRIVDQELWDAVKGVQREINRHATPLWQKNRPKNLFSNLIKCGWCGGGCSMVNTHSVGCSTARNKGTCANRLTYRREKLEQEVTAALTRHLMDDEMCREFCAAYVRRLNQLREEHNRSLAGYRKEYTKLERERQQIIRSIADGVPGTLLKDRAVAVQARREELERLLAETKHEPVVFHPKMSARYHEKVRDLIASLSGDSTRAEASTIVRSLIERIVLTPCAEGDRLVVDLIGDLAGILAIATTREKPDVMDGLSKLRSAEPDSKNAPGNAEGVESASKMGRLPTRFGVREAVVAGAGFEPAAFRL